MIMPLEGWLPLAMEAPMSVSEMLDGFRRSGVEELFEQVGTAGDAEFFGEDAERVFGGDEVDAGDAGSRTRGRGAVRGRRLRRMRR